MTETRLHTQLKAPPSLSFTPVRNGVLQRKCACGKSAGVAGDREECSKQNLSLQRSSRNSKLKSRNSEPKTRGAELKTRNPELEARNSEGVPSIVHEVLRAPGQPLDTATSAFMGPRFGHDFSRVRVHTDARAAESARSVTALAYTVGSDVVFGSGQYRPGTAEGDRLLGHELTHVVQQSGRRQYGAKAFAGEAGDAFEREADRAAEALSTGEPATVIERGNTPLLQGQFGTMSCGLVNDPDTGAPGCVNMGGCQGNCVLHPFPAHCTCQPSYVGQPVFPQPELPLPPLFPPGQLPVPAPAPPVPAVPPATVTGLTVNNQRSAITFEEPGSGGPHFVTVAGRSGDENVVIAATTDRPLNPGEHINWAFDPAGGGAPDPADPLQALVSRRLSTRVHVTAESGGVNSSLTVWAIFARVSTVNAPAIGFSPPNAPPATSACNGVDFCVFSRADFHAEVFPRDLFHTPDRPDFVRPPVMPPGGTTTCGLPLSGGVNNRFDMSRQVDCMPNDPGGHLAGPQFCSFRAGVFPADTDNAEGNDDGGVTDEKNDPFVAGNTGLYGLAVPVGFLGSGDTPSLDMPHGVGVNGDTLEVRYRFREFARLDYHQGWWLISNRVSWFTNLRAKRVGGWWVDNGSTAG